MGLTLSSEPCRNLEIDGNMAMIYRSIYQDNVEIRVRDEEGTADILVNGYFVITVWNNHKSGWKPEDSISLAYSLASRIKGIVENG
jgi:hypothetical protein